MVFLYYDGNMLNDFVLELSIVNYFEMKQLDNGQWIRGGFISFNVD